MKTIKYETKFATMLNVARVLKFNMNFLSKDIREVVNEMINSNDFEIAGYRFINENEIDISKVHKLNEVIKLYDYLAFKTY